MSLLVLITVFVFTLGGQLGAADISGFTRDASNGESLPYTNVYLKGESRGASSNESGYYVIVDVPPGTYTLVASLVGYRTHTGELVIAEDNVVRDVSLIEQALLFEAKVIKTEAEEVDFDISPGRTALQPRELKAAPAAIEAVLHIL